MKGIDIQGLRTFVAICELQNLTAAARHLGTTQAAVSQRLKRLENEVSTALIDRNLRPLQPTHAGQILLQRARQILAEFDQIESDLLEQGSLALQELKLGLSDSLSSTLVPSLVNVIRDSVRHLSVRVDSTIGVSRLFLLRELHAVITSDPLSDRDDMERHALYNEPMVLVLRRGDAENGVGELALLQQLARTRTFIRYSPVGPLNMQIETHLRRLGLEPPRGLEFNTSEDTVEMVRHGLGWTITTPLCLLQSRVNLNELDVRKLPFSGASRTITLVARRDELGTLPRRLAAVSSAIIQEKVVLRIGAELPWLQSLMGVVGDTHLFGETLDKLRTYFQTQK